MSYPDTANDLPQVTYFATQSGSAVNVQVQALIQNPSVKSYHLNLIFKVVSGSNFASQNATVEVSNDNSEFITIDSSISLGTGTLAAKAYSPSSLGTTLALNPALWRYIRVTIPQIAATQTRLLWSIK